MSSWLAPDLDDPVRVEDDRGPAGHGALVLVIAPAPRHAERHVARDVEEARAAAGIDDQRRRVAGADHPKRLLGGVEHQVGRRRHRGRAQLQQQAVEAPDDRRGAVAVERVRAQRRAQLRHERRRRQPAPDDVAHRHRHAAPAEREDVVPVAAEARRIRRGQVARGDLDTGDGLQLLREQRTLQRRGEPLLLVALGVFDGQRGAVGRHLQQLAVVLGEPPLGQRPHVQHTQDPTLHQQRHAQQRPDPLLAQDRIEDVGMVDVIDRDRPPLRRDPPGEPAADRNPHAPARPPPRAPSPPAPAAPPPPHRAAGSPTCPSP